MAEARAREDRRARASSEDRRARIVDLALACPSASSEDRRRRRARSVERGSSSASTLARTRASASTTREDRRASIRLDASNVDASTGLRIDLRRVEGRRLDASNRTRVRSNVCSVARRRNPRPQLEGEGSRADPHRPPVGQKTATKNRASGAKNNGGNPGARFFIIHRRPLSSLEIVIFVTSKRIDIEVGSA